MPLTSERPIRVLIPRGSTERLTGQIVYQGPLPAPVSAGTEVARLRVLRGKTLILDHPLVTMEDIGQGSLPQRALDASLELGYGLFRTYVPKK